MACISSPESLAVVGYQMQTFVSARDEGKARNEARWLHRVQLSPCRWSTAGRCTLVGDRLSKAMIRGDKRGPRQSASMLDNRTDPCGKGHIFRVAATLMNCCEIRSAELFLHGRGQLTWLARVIWHGLGQIERLRSWQLAEDREEKQMELGTSGPAMVHRVKRGGHLLKMQKKCRLLAREHGWWSSKGRIRGASGKEGLAAAHGVRYQTSCVLAMERP